MCGPVQVRYSTCLPVNARASVRVQVMTCEAHDDYAAGSQFITHTMGRMLGQLGIQSTPINTKGFESLLGVMNNTCSDSMDLFVALYQHNPAAREQLCRIEEALKYVRRSLDSGGR